MAAHRSREPLIWGLFSGGGMISAFLLPAVALIVFFALPLGWIDAPSREALAGRLGHPLTRLALFGVAMLCYYHWAHRFRYTLYDGLQLKHLNDLIAVVCYGGASALTAFTGYLLLTMR